MDTDKEELKRISEGIIGAAFEVTNTLGVGFLEKVYERALVRDLLMRGMKSESQVPLKVMYKNEVVGEYFADIVVNDLIIVELKCVAGIAKEHMAQCINYLKATGYPLALLLNFQKTRVEVKRIIADQ